MAEAPAACPACGASALLATPAPPPRRRAREPVWPLAAMSLVLVAGVIWVAVLFWPPAPTRDAPEEDKKGEVDGGPTLLIGTPEGLVLLADVLDLQTARVR